MLKLNMKMVKIPKPVNQGLLSTGRAVNSSRMDTEFPMQMKPIDFRTFDLNELIGNHRELEMFKRFLESHDAINDLLCWMDIEAYLRADPHDYNAIEDQARALKRNYLNKKYLFSAKNSPIDAETQNIVREKNIFFRTLLY